MHKLVHAAMSWMRESDSDQERCPDSDLMQEYHVHLASSRSKPNNNTVSKFARLVSELASDHHSTPVLRIRGHRVHFEPLKTPEGQHHDTQCACFSMLNRYWRSGDTCKTIEELVVDLSDATTGRVSALMRGVSVDDVIRGIHIWETLPCRIRKIKIFLPKRMSLARWTIRKLVPMCVSDKVNRKLELTDKPDDDGAEHGNPHTDPDAIGVTTNDVEYTDSACA